MHSLNKFEEEVLELISIHLDEYDLLHTLGVVAQAKIISSLERLSKKDAEILVIAAYLHDYTKRDGPIQEHHLTSAKFAQNYLQEKKYPHINEVISVIKTHSFPIKRFHDKNIVNPKPTAKLQLLLIKADMLEQLEPAGFSRMFVKNVKKGLTFDKNMDDIKGSVLEAEEVLKWTEHMLQNI